MKILLLSHAFHSLTQRIFVDLLEAGHDVSVELDIADSVSIRAASLFHPDIILAPYLKRRIPKELLDKYLCLILHPGIVGDRGPSSLDFALLEGRSHWAVTVFQATDVLDGGPVFDSVHFPMRLAPKSSLYRHEVTEAASAAVRQTLLLLDRGQCNPKPQPEHAVRVQPKLTAEYRRVHWDQDSTLSVLRKIHSGDSFPGTMGDLFGKTYRLLGVHPETNLRGVPGTVLATFQDAICVATVDGAVWISHLRSAEPLLDRVPLKLPAKRVLSPFLSMVPESTVQTTPVACSVQEIRYEEQGLVGMLYFNFMDGAMSTERCHKLKDLVLSARQKPTRVVVLFGGEDFFSNGIDLCSIEAAEHPAEESLNNLLAMNALVHAILTTTTHRVIAALQGNAGAGGAFLAFAADNVCARKGVILNPHYRNMGNLYGSEYWTYTLPKKVGLKHSLFLRELRLPMGTEEARSLGLVDRVFDGPNSAFRDSVIRYATDLASDDQFDDFMTEKRAKRTFDEAQKPLDSYAQEELAHMRLRFFGFDPSYHVARYNFVHHIPISRTPLHLAKHRDLRWQTHHDRKSNPG